MGQRRNSRTITLEGFDDVRTLLRAGKDIDTNQQLRAWREEMGSDKYVFSARQQVGDALPSYIAAIDAINTQLDSDPNEHYAQALGVRDTVIQLQQPQIILSDIEHENHWYTDHSFIGTLHTRININYTSIPVEAGYRDCIMEQTHHFFRIGTEYSRRPEHLIKTKDAQQLPELVMKEDALETILNYITQEVSRQ